MSLTSDDIETLVRRFRDTIPREMKFSEFEMPENFPDALERFKLPLISYLSDKIEEALRTVPDEVSQEFAWGYLDGVLYMLRMIAELSITESSRS